MGMKNSGTSRWLPVVSSSATTKDDLEKSIGSASARTDLAADQDEPDNTPCDTPRLSSTSMQLGSDESAGADARAVIMFQTLDGGWSVGKLSGTDVPPQVCDAITAMLGTTDKANQVLVSALIAKLSSNGFSIASQSSIGSAGNLPPELLFTMTGPAVSSSGIISDLIGGVEQTDEKPRTSSTSEGVVRRRRVKKNPSAGTTDENSRCQSPRSPSCGCRVTGAVTAPVDGFTL